MTGAAVLRAGAQVFLGWGAAGQDAAGRAEGAEREPETTSAHERTPLVMTVPATLLLLLALASGLGPGVARRASDGAARFEDRAAYTATVLEGAPSPQPEPESPTPGPTRSA